MVATGDLKSPALNSVRVRIPLPALGNNMKDYIYIDTMTNEIILVCLCVSGFSEADNLFKDIIGVWPWSMKHIHMRHEPTSIKEGTDLEGTYILE